MRIEFFLTMMKSVSRCLLLISNVTYSLKILTTDGEFVNHINSHESYETVLLRKPFVLMLPSLQNTKIIFVIFRLHVWTQSDLGGSPTRNSTALSALWPRGSVRRPSPGSARQSRVGQKGIWPKFTRASELPQRIERTFLSGKQEKKGKNRKTLVNWNVEKSRKFEIPALWLAVVEYQNV